jgi:mono/diheme cytochrome c family protein
MAKYGLLGLFSEVASAADAIDGLHDLGIPDGRISVMSGMPYQGEMLGRPRVRTKMSRVALGGAILGVLTALFLTAGIFLLYPLVQGGQPIVPIPPSLIVTFEVTMLGTMWVTFLGFVVLNRLPVFGRPAYDARVTAGDIGVLVHVDEEVSLQAEQVLHQSGAHDVQRIEGGEWINTGAWVRFATAAGFVLVILTGVSLLFFYDVLKIPFPSQMIHQDSIGYVQGPRLAAPAEAVPVQGPALIAGWPASEPVPATDDSLQRGQVLFSVNCALCHGKSGVGDGPLSKYFSPQPADLTSEEVQGLSDEAVFLMVTQGRGVMPSLAENLSPVERWDVINYVQSLKDGGE